MRLPRLTVALLAASLLVAACGASPPASPSPSPVRLATPEDAVRYVSARSPLLAAIPPHDPMMPGDPHRWTARELPGRGDDAGWQITFRVGWGDCPAGCINRHEWTYAVTVDGRVMLVAEEGPALPQELVDELLAAAAVRDLLVGIAGHASAGPTCPVERPDDPGCWPRSVSGAVVVIRDASGSEIARVTTDDAGFFRVPLAPGAYTLEGLPVEGLMGTPAPVAVTFAAGTEAWAELGYDTGIR